MFYGAQSFNQDLSAWDVSAVTDMSWMFQGATSFDQILCGVSWANTIANKNSMFAGSSGSISMAACTSTTQAALPITTTKNMTSSINSATTLTVSTRKTSTAVTIAAITVITMVCVVMLVIARARSKRSSGDIELSEMPLIATNDLSIPTCDPIFTSPATETDPGTRAGVGTGPSTNIAHTSPTAGADLRAMVAKGKTATTTTSSKAETDLDTAMVPLCNRTFATSHYKRFYSEALTTVMQHKLLSAVENVLMLYAKRMNALTDDQAIGTFIDLDVMDFILKLQEDAFKHDEAMQNDVDAMAEYLWTSSKKHGILNGMELCSVLNAVIRDDVAEEMEAAAVIFRCLNSRRVRRQNVSANINLQSYPPNGETWRGGGFRREHRAFFERMVGKKYRVPGFLATSVRREVAAAFAFKADVAHPSHPTAIWRITFDPRGKEHPQYRVKHMTLVSKTLIAGEHEYLFAPYSVFTLVSVKWSEQDLINPHEFTVQAAHDNKEEDECLPLTPWY